jgi:hypothetical protein
MLLFASCELKSNGAICQMLSNDYTSPFRHDRIRNRFLTAEFESRVSVAREAALLALRREVARKYLGNFPREYEPVAAEVVTRAED